MSLNPHKGQSVQSYHAQPASAPFDDGASSLHAQKLAAWHLAIGERSPTVHPPGRSARLHRGNLPDVDMAFAVPMATKPSRVTMIAGWVRNVFRDTAKEGRRFTPARNA